jgi:hypothetical protein
MALKFQKKWYVIEAIVLGLSSAVLSDFSMRGPSRSCFLLFLQHESMYIMSAVGWEVNMNILRSGEYGLCGLSATFAF